MTSPGPNGWHGLQSIVSEAREIHREETAAPMVACPRDGEPLLSGGGSGNITYCPYCGYKPGVTA